MDKINELPQQVSCCGINAICPYTSEQKEFINNILFQYGNDLFIITEIYKYGRLLFNLKEFCYYIENNNDKNALMYDYFHYLYWKKNEGVYNNLLRQGLNSEDARTLIRRNDMICHNSQNQCNNDLNSYVSNSYRNLELEIQNLQRSGYDAEYIRRYASNKNIQIANKLNEMRSQIMYNQNEKAAFDNQPQYDLSNLWLPPSQPQVHPNAVGYYQQPQYQYPQQMSPFVQYTKTGEQYFNLSAMNPMYSGYQYPQYNGYYPMYSGYQYPQYNGYYPMYGNDWMTHDQKDYEFGVEVVSNGNVVNRYGRFEEKPPISSTEQSLNNINKIKICLTYTDDNGNKCYSGNDDEFIKKVIEENKEKEKQEAKKDENAKASDTSNYKDVAVKMKAQEQESLFFALCKSIKCFDAKLADELAWSRTTLFNSDFIRFRNECIEKLKLFKKANPSSTEMIPSISYDRLGNLVLESRVPNSAEQSFIEEHSKNAEKFLYGLKNLSLSDEKSTDEEIKNISPSEELIKKIQSSPTMFCQNEDEYNKYVEWNLLREQYYSPNQLNTKAKYHLYKQMMKTQCPKGKDYDKWFDDWWNKPQRMYKENPEKFNIDRNKYYRDMRRNQIARLIPTSLENTQKKLESLVSQEVYKFMGGNIQDHQSLNDFLNGQYGLGYLLHRCGEMQLMRHLSSVRRYWDPNQFQNNMRTGIYNTQLAAQQNIPYDQITSTEAYNNKRQAFINSIFRKNQLGYLSK